MKHTLLKSALALFAAAFLSPSLKAQVADPAAQYRCANGMILQTEHIKDGEEQRLNLEFLVRIARQDEAVTRLDLPLVNGSEYSKRFANENAEFLLRRTRAEFRSDATEEHAEIPKTRCWAVDTNSEKPVMKATQTGKYFVYPPELYDAEEESPLWARYLPAESICFLGSEGVSYAFARGSKPSQAVAFHSNGEWEILRVDAREVQGAESQFMAREQDDLRNQNKIVLHFSSNLREEPSASDDAGILTKMSRFTDPSEIAECAAGPNLVYYATFEEHSVAIALDDGELTLTLFGWSEREKPQEMRGGYLSKEGDLNIFNFFSDGNRVRIFADDEGRFTGHSISIDRTDGKGFTAFPKAYFSAPPEALSKADKQLSHETADWIESLLVCDHLATKEPYDQAQKELFANKFVEFECEKVRDRFKGEYRKSGRRSPLRNWLKLNRPDWP